MFIPFTGKDTLDYLAPQAKMVLKDSRVKRVQRVFSLALRTRPLVIRVFLVKPVGQD